MDYLEELEAARQLGDAMQSDFSRLSETLEKKGLDNPEALGYETYMSLLEGRVLVAKWTKLRSQSRPLSMR